MADPAEGPRADVAEAADHLDAAHRLLARAKREWNPTTGLGCPCGPPALREALESTDTASRRVQEVLYPVPGE